jgi:hypothetical protein
MVILHDNNFVLVQNDSLSKTMLHRNKTTYSRPQHRGFPDLIRVSPGLTV